MERRNTRQRQLVLDAVRELDDHPTADEVYLRVREKDEHVSRGTVYRNLHILVESGVTFEDQEESQTSAPVLEPETSAPALDPEMNRLRFSTVDIYGRPVDESIIQGARLVILNIWEPWCGPCVKELPSMEKLYEKYKDAGVLFLGLCCRHEDSTAEDSREIVEDVGITYPVIMDCAELKQFDNDGWPENYFFDGEGKLLDPEPDGGYKTEEAWEQLILKYLR